MRISCGISIIAIFSPKVSRLTSAKPRNGKIRLIIAVDELIEPLRAIVTFLNSQSNFDILLLEVSSFEGKTKEKVLAPSLFGYATKRAPPPKPLWDLQRFLADAGQRCESEVIDIISNLYDFTKNNADNILWGRGASKGSFNFHKFEPPIPIFQVCSDGLIYLNFGYLKDKSIREDIQESFRVELNKIPGIKVPKDVLTGRKFPSIKARILGEPASLKKFEDSVLSLCSQIESSDKERKIEAF